MKKSKSFDKMYFTIHFLFSSNNTEIRLLSWNDISELVKTKKTKSMIS